MRAARTWYLRFPPFPFAASRELTAALAGGLLGRRSIRAARYRTTQAAAMQACELCLGGRMALAYPKWASLPEVGVLSLLHACPKFRVPTSVHGGRFALTSLGLRLLG